METSILETLKEMLNIPIEIEAFDRNIIEDANAAFMTLNQLGVGPENGFALSGYSETWYDFLRTRSPLLDSVKSYVYHKIRIVFDPPVSSFVVDTIQRRIEELEWRIMIQAERIDNNEGIEPHALRSSWNEVGRKERQKESRKNFHKFK